VSIYVIADLRNNEIIARLILFHDSPVQRAIDAYRLLHSKRVRTKIGSWFCNGVVIPTPEFEELQANQRRWKHIVMINPRALWETEDQIGFSLSHVSFVLFAVTI